MREIREKIKEAGLGGFLVLTKINRQYLSGFTGSSGILWIGGDRGDKGMELYVDDRYLLRARRESDLRIKEIGQIGEIGGKGYIGVEDRITLREFADLKKKLKLPAARFRITHNVVEELRAVKTIREIGRIRKGARIIDRIFREITRGIKRFKTESDIALFIEKRAGALGAGKLAFEPIVAWGPNAAAPHHNPGKTRIRRGNFLLLDFGVVVGGQHSDFTRTLFIGRPKRWQERMYEAVRKAQEAGIREIREIGGKRVDQVIRDSLASAGYGRYFTHNSGHGVGLEIHELPNLSQNSEDLLRPGMVVTVEPGVYIEGKGGVRIEDMVVVGKKPEVLSKVRKDLKGMTI